MQNLIINFISIYGYFAILLLIMIENIFPPIPSEVILSFSGFISKDANLNLLIIIIFSTIGSIIGAIILYYMGYFIGEDGLIKFANSKVGKLLRLKEEKIISSISYFKEKGASSIFFCRFIPILRSLISIPAGIANYNIFSFLILTTIGSTIWNSIFVLLGNIFGENWSIIANFMDKYSNYIFILAIFLYFIYKYFKKKIKVQVIK